jgi:hypothetical protein
LAVGLFQAWFLDLGPRNFAARQSTRLLADLYVEGLAKGHSYLSVTQDPHSTAESQKYQTMDVSYYGTRTYVYFGIVPFALLMVPWHFVTGTFMSQAACILILLQLGYLSCGCALFLLFMGDRSLRMDLFLVAGLLTAIAGSGTLVLTARPAIYEIEGACAYACLAAAAACLAASFAAKGRSSLFLGLASLFAGLTMGCRPSYLPAVGLLALSIGTIAWRSEATAAGRARRVACFWMPLAAVGVSLALWNYVRFSSILEFGYSFTRFAQNKPALVHWSPGNLPYNMHGYLLGGVRLGGYFPFIEGARDGPIPRPVATHEPFDQLYGCLLLFPVLVYCLLPLLKRSAFACLLMAAAAGNLVFLSGMGFGTYRYPADFLGLLSLSAGIGVCLIPRMPGRVWRFAAAGLLVPCLIWSLAACICLTTAVARATALFEEQRPGDFSLLSRPFNAVAYRMESLRNSGPSEIRLRLVLPADRFGGVDPILVVGEAGLQDFVYAYYNRPGEIEIGFESIGYGGPLSAPRKIDYSKPHVVDISLGSFLPPDTHPLLKGISTGEISLARDFVRVAIDGQPVLESEAHLHRVRARMLVGESPDNGAFGKRFAGKIVAVERPLLRDTGVYPHWSVGQFGPVALSLRLRVMPAGTRQPLICLGYRPTGGMLFLESLPSEKVRLGWMAYNGDAVFSNPRDWDFEKTHSLEFHAGSLLPPLQSDLWPSAESAATRNDSKLHFLCRLDGNDIWEMSQETPYAAPASVTVGWNSILQSGVADSLNGEISSVRREPW